MSGACYSTGLAPKPKGERNEPLGCLATPQGFVPLSLGLGILFLLAARDRVHVEHRERIAELLRLGLLAGLVLGRDFDHESARTIEVEREVDRDEILLR